jgi:hypothetical protein
LGGFEQAGTELTSTILEFGFDVNIRRGAVPRNFDVESGRDAAGRNVRCFTITLIDTFTFGRTPLTDIT